MKTIVCTHLIKSEDLNHHGTLYAGRMAEWFVEGTFIAAARLYGNPENIVCAKMHGLKFNGPATKGDIIELVTRVVHAGNTSLTVYGKVTKNEGEKVLVDGFVTFVCVDGSGQKMSHQLVLDDAIDAEDETLRTIAKSLR